MFSKCSQMLNLFKTKKQCLFSYEQTYWRRFDKKMHNIYKFILQSVRLLNKTLDINAFVWHQQLKFRMCEINPLLLLFESFHLEKLGASYL
jgi:hypothetical protein